MFTGIKDKLRTVKNNVTLLTSGDSPPKSKRPEGAPFNPGAGSAILQHFQNAWEELHGLNEENARAAEEVAAQITQASAALNKSKNDVDMVGHVLISSNLTSNIAQCLTQVRELYSTCEIIEQKLLELEDVLEETEYQQMVKRHRYLLDSYTARKQENLDKLQQSLEEGYRKKLADSEESKKNILEERQKVFQEAFKSDLEMYKSLGTIPKVNLPKNQNGAILEEIQLDYDQNELDQFFSDEPAT